MNRRGFLGGIGALVGGGAAAVVLPKSVAAHSGDAFTMNGYRVSTPVLSLKGPTIEITGKGSMNMQSSVIAYDMNMALAQPLLNKMTVPQLRAAFVDRGDGFSAVDFKVFGTSTNPQNDLASRVGKAAAGEAVKKLLGGRKLF